MAPPAPTLRHAETKDIPRIAAVIIAAMDFSPHWTYRYPYRKEFPDVHRQMTEKVITDYVKASKNGICVSIVSEVDVEIEVEVEVQSTTEEVLLGSMGSGKTKKRKEKQSRKEIVGVAIAQLPGTFVEPMTRVIKRTVPEGEGEKKAAPPPAANAPPPPHRADGHLERAKAFGAEFGPAKKRYFDVPYGNNQLYIDFMAVDPGYHRRGIAMQLLEWMLELARREEDAKAVTLFASPMGEGLYKKAGFEEVACVTVRLEGDTGDGAEGVSAPCMVWLREKHT